MKFLWLFVWESDLFIFCLCGHCGGIHSCIIWNKGQQFWLEGCNFQAGRWCRSYASGVPCFCTRVCSSFQFSPSGEGEPLLWVFHPARVLLVSHLELGKQSSLNLIIVSLIVIKSNGDQWTHSCQIGTKRIWTIISEFSIWQRKKKMVLWRMSF